MLKRVLIPCLLSVSLTVVHLAGATYYLAPNGQDTNPGTRAEPWGTFSRAWQSLYPGDTLVLLDGVYRQSLNPNRRNGRPGKPISIRAENDGRVLIDGDLDGDGRGDIPPVKIGDTWTGEQGENPVGDYFVVEGIVAANSSEYVWRIPGNHNELRRISGYNANPDTNSHVIGIRGDFNLLEDAVASGTGRKMMFVFKGEHNIFRRCFAFWRKWDGREWHDHWPWGDGIEVYNGSFNTYENVISVGHFDSIGLLSQDTLVEGNRILGSISINGGTDLLGNLFEWGSIRPQPSNAPAGFTSNPGWPSRNGFTLRASGDFRGNLLQDVLAWGNAGLGVEVNLRSATYGKTASNNRINRATFMNNGGGYNNVDARPDQLAQLDSVTDSRIAVIKDLWNKSESSLTGEGARLKHRYINGILRDGTDGTEAQLLWPWPMENRIRNEIGISVTNLIAQIIPEQVSAISPLRRGYLAISPSFLPFGIVNGPGAATRELTLRNIGIAPVVVTDWRIKSGGGSAFSLEHGTCPSLPFELAPDQSCAVSVSFSVNSPSPKTAELVISSGDSPPFPFEPTAFLSGIGRLVPTSIAIPGKLEAEHYDSSSGRFQIIVTSDDGGGLKLGGIEPSSEVNFSVDVLHSGTYEVSVRYASADRGGEKRLSVLVDEKTVAAFSPDNTGGWEDFSTASVGRITLTKGLHTLKIVFDTGGFDLNYLVFQPSETSTPAAPRGLLIRQVN